MARSISVKVPTALLVQQIEERIAQIEKDIEEYPAKREAFEKDEEAYKSKIATFVADYLGKNLHRVGYDYNDTIRLLRGVYGIGGTNSKLEISFDTAAIESFPKYPKAPEPPNQRESFGRDYTTRKELLEKNLRILKMTSQEEVNASTYGAIMDIL